MSMYMGKQRTKIWDKWKKVEYKGMTSTAMVAYYRARQRKGDDARLAVMTGYAEGTVRGMLKGKIKITGKMATAMGDLAWMRETNSSAKARKERAMA